MTIEYSAEFERLYKRMSLEVVSLTEKKESLFRKNPYHPSLKTHKLHGKWSGYFSFSINYHYRIIFRFITSQHVLFVAIGKHDVYE